MSPSAPGVLGGGPTAPSPPRASLASPGSGRIAEAAASSCAQRDAELHLLERWVPTVFAGRRVLEVAAGAGEWTRFIAPQTQSLLATDTCGQALARAQTQVPSRKVRFVQADAFALPPDLGCFDAAFAGFWVSRIPNDRLPAFFASLHARLEPGAKVLLLDQRVLPPTIRELEPRVTPEGEPPRAAWNDNPLAPTRHARSGEDLLQMVAGIGTRPVLHQWMFFWALCYEVVAPATPAV